MGLIGLGACGGATTGTPGATPGTDSPSSDGEPGQSDPEGEESSAAPPTPRCDDGSCFLCGEGMCPKGFYCDEKAAGGAACSWLPECAAQPSCGCLSKVLGADCACSEKSGGVYCD